VNELKVRIKSELQNMIEDGWTLKGFNRLRIKGIVNSIHNNEITKKRFCRTQKRFFVMRLMACGRHHFNI